MAIQKSFLSPLGYSFTLQKLPKMMLNVTSVIFPGLQLQDVDLQTPFKIIYYPDKLIYNDLVVTFMVSEDMQDYIELFNWTNSIGRPESFANSPPNPNAGIDNSYRLDYLSDATLTILNSAMKPNIEVTFKDVFPYQISDIVFASQQSDIDYIEASVNFRVLSFNIKAVP